MLWGLASSDALVQAQRTDWPHALTTEERNHVERQGFHPVASRGIETPPPFDNLRTAAEWEEIEALTIAWTSYPCIQKQIVAAAQAQCQVIIFAENPSQVNTYLSGTGCGGPVPLENVSVVEAEYNSVWIRDYGATTVYGNWNDDRVLVDWLYNRPRPLDDAIPDVLGDFMGIPVYSATAAPFDLMNTGGNWMSDGFGTAFASELIVEENSGGSTWWTDFPDHTEQEIDELVADFHGVDHYIKMPVLPYDGIHHIDMHMKLLDEHRLLVAEYPNGTADGPQINANLEYVLSNFTTRWGTPFEVIRIPSPPEQGAGGGYPNQGGWYLTYTNSVFVNNTVLLPTYYTQYDTTAIRIYQEALPGYEIVGIDCDNNAEPIIAASGAIHCITHSVGVADPLMISHLPLPDTEQTEGAYNVMGEVFHRSGIADVTLHWALDDGGVPGAWNTSPLLPGFNPNGEYFGSIPAQPVGTRIHYYIAALSGDGKFGTRPMPAPAGYWTFDVLGPANGVSEADVWAGRSVLGAVFPNPASAITCVPLDLPLRDEAHVGLYDAQGRCRAVLHEGSLPAGPTKLFFHANELPGGMYVIRYRGARGGEQSTRVVVR